MHKPNSTIHGWIECIIYKSLNNAGLPNHCVLNNSTGNTNAYVEQESKEGNKICLNATFTPNLCVTHE